MPITMNFKNNGTLLDLSGQDPNLTDADITEEFKASIKAQGDLCALNLSNNALSPSKLVELAKWAIENTKIRQFDVSNNTGKDIVALDQTGLSSPKVTVRPIKPEIKIQEAITSKASREEIWTLSSVQSLLEQDGTVLNLSSKNLYDYDIASLWRFFENNASAFAKLKKINLSNNYLTKNSLITCAKFWNDTSENAGTESNIIEINLKGNVIEDDLNEINSLEGMLENHPKISVWPLERNAFSKIETDKLNTIDQRLKQNLENHYELLGAVLFIYKKAFKNEKYREEMNFSSALPANFDDFTYDDCICFFKENPACASEVTELIEQGDLRKRTEIWCANNNVFYQDNWKFVVGKIFNEGMNDLQDITDPAVLGNVRTRVLDRKGPTLIEFLLPEAFRHKMDIFAKEINFSESAEQAIEESLRMCAYFYYLLMKLSPDFDSEDLEKKKNLLGVASSFFNQSDRYSKLNKGSIQEQNGRIIFHIVFTKIFYNYLDNNVNNKQSLKKTLEELMETAPSLSNLPVYLNFLPSIPLSINQEENPELSRITMTLEPNEKYLKKVCTDENVNEQQYYKEQVKIYRYKLNEINPQPEKTRNNVEQKFIQKEYKTAQGKLFKTAGEKIKTSIKTVKDQITNTWGYYFASFFPAPVLNYFYPEPPKLEKLYNEINNSTEYKNPHEYVREAQLIVKGTEYLYGFDESIKDEEIELDNIGYAAARIAYLYHDELIKILEDRDSYTQLRVIDVPKKSDNIDDYIKFYAQLKNSKDAFMLVGHFNLNRNKDEYKPLDTKKYNEKCGTWKQKIKNISVVAPFDFSQCFLEDKNTLDLSNKKFDDINIQELLAYLAQNHDIKTIQFEAIDGLHASILIDAISDLGHAIELSFEESILDENAQGRIDTLKTGSSTAVIMVAAPGLRSSSLGEDGKGVYGRINSDDHTGSLSAQNLAQLAPVTDDVKKPAVNRGISGHTDKTDLEAESLEDIGSTKANSPPPDEEPLLSGRITPKSH